LPERSLEDIGLAVRQRRGHTGEPWVHPCSKRLY
jgi:hypothetical protein